MTDTTLQHPTLAQEAENVFFALRKLTVATSRLVTALWAAETQPITKANPIPHCNIVCSWRIPS